MGTAGAIGAGAAGFALVGCGDDDDDDDGQNASSPTSDSSPQGLAEGSASPAASGTASAGGAPVKGGRVRTTSANNTWDTFDLHRSRFTPFAVLAGYTNLGIVHVTDYEQRTIEGAMAETYEQPDDTTMTFTLRDGLTWHDKPPVDGRACTAEDMAYTIMRNKDGKLIDGTDDFTFWRKAEFQFVDTAEAVDDRTLRVTFTQPIPIFLNTLASPYMKAYAQEAVEQFEGTFRELKAESIIGNAAYVLTAFDPEGNVTIDRFDGWAGDAWVDGLDFLPLFTDQTAQRTAFEQKQIDYFTPAQQSVLDELMRSHEGQVQSANVYAANPMAGTYYGGTPPWSDKNLIGAIFRAFDRRGLVQQLAQGRASISGNIPPSQTAYGFGISEEELITLPGYLESRDEDIAEAKKMWEAGGGPDLGTVTVDIPDIWDGLYGAADIVISQLNAAFGGSQFQARIEPYSTINAKIVQQQYGNGSANIWYGWISDITTFEPTFSLYLNHNSGQPNFQQWGVTIPEVDTLTTQSLSEFDLEARSDLLKQIERALIENYGAGIPYNIQTIEQPIAWNYYHWDPVVPFVSSHLTASRRWIDSNDPSFEGRQ